MLIGGLATVFGERLQPDFLASLPRITLPEFGSLSALAAELEGPDWQAWRNPSVYVVAITLALVASLETLLSQEALNKLRPQNPHPSPNRDAGAGHRKHAGRFSRRAANHRGDRAQFGQRQRRRAE